MLGGLNSSRMAGMPFAVSRMTSGPSCGSSVLTMKTRVKVCWVRKVFCTARRPVQISLTLTTATDTLLQRLGHLLSDGTDHRLMTLHHGQRVGNPLLHVLCGSDLKVRYDARSLGRAEGSGFRQVDLIEAKTVGQVTEGLEQLQVGVPAREATEQLHLANLLNHVKKLLVGG